MQTSYQIVPFPPSPVNRGALIQQVKRKKFNRITSMEIVPKRLPLEGKLSGAEIGWIKAKKIIRA